MYRQKIINPKNNKQYVEFVAYEDSRCQPVLGLSASEQMGLIEVHEECFDRVNLLKLSAYDDVLDGKLGCLPGKQSLTLKSDAVPIAMPDRRVLIAVRAKLKEELERLVALQVIEPVDKPTLWLSQLVVTYKKTGEIRICLDPHEVNKVLVREQLSLPILEDTLHQLRGATVFSKADLSSAYWHVKLDSEASDLTTFQTCFGRYRWKRLPFGLSASSEILQKKLSQALEDLPGVIFMADDIVIFGKDDKEHEQNLCSFLKRCQGKGIKLNKKKLELKTKSITFMGHCISSNGISIDPAKVEAIVSTFYATTHQLC